MFLDDTSSDQDNNHLNQRNDYNFNENDSMNDTAASFIQNDKKHIIQDDNNYAQQTLKSFYQKNLKIQIQWRYQELQNDDKIFKYDIIGSYPPQPLVYFLPYTILIDNRQNLNDIRTNIVNKYRQRIENKQAQLNIFFVDTKQRDQLFVSIHSKQQLVFYKIKKVSINQKYHQFVDCLDKDLLVDRLFNFYKITYQKFYFQEISVMFMYWAYLRKFLNQDYLSPSAIKILIICLFIHFGCGIKKIIPSYSNKFWKNQSECLNMSKSNKKGQCIIDKDILKYRNYSIQQKKGFYILSQKKYQIIRKIVPIQFPIGKRNSQKNYMFEYKKQQRGYFKQEAQKTYKKIKQDNIIKITRYYLLMLLFQSMNDYFNYTNKLILDLKKPDIFFQQNSDQFLLQIHHPVFQTVISKSLVENGSSARRIQSQLKSLIQKNKQNQQAIYNIRNIFLKK